MAAAAAAAEVQAATERRIAVAVDESEESMYALTWCLENVVSHKNDTVFLVHAKSPPTVYTAFDGTGYMFSSELVAAMDRYGDQVADSVMEKATKVCRDHAVVKLETKVGSGDARDVICKMVEKLGADILVIGSHGYGLIQRTFLGSVSNHCVQHVKCPVMVVKKSQVKN